MTNDQPFSIEEESTGGGVSYCWVEQKADGFYLYGNELGEIGGPCTSPVDAAVGMGYGMDSVNIDTSFSDCELLAFLKSGALILSNVERLTINEQEIKARDPECILSEVLSLINS